MQMVDVSTVVSSLLSMFRVRCFGSIASAFRKYSERRKYYEMFGIITQIQTILNLGTIPNFRNHCEIFGTIPRVRNFFTHGGPLSINSQQFLASQVSVLKRNKTTNSWVLLNIHFSAVLKALVLGNLFILSF